MNERIRELAEEHGFIHEHMSIGERNDALTKYQEFAELIVRQCCDIFVELRTRPADLAVKDVKKHFGVEE